MLYPTEKALALLPEIQALLDGWEQQLTLDMSPEDRALLAGLLEKMMDRAAAWMEGR